MTKDTSTASKNKTRMVTADTKTTPSSTMTMNTRNGFLWNDNHGYQAGSLLDDNHWQQDVSYNYSKILHRIQHIGSSMEELLSFKESQVSDSEMHALFYEHFEVHKDSISICSDVSKYVDGVGFVTLFPDLAVKRRLHSCASVFTAVLCAILLALKFLITKSGNSFVVFSDTRSALLAIKSYNSQHPLWRYDKGYIFRKYRKVEFCLVRSHTGISSNEKVDASAKAAVHEMQVCNKISLIQITTH